MSAFKKLELIPDSEQELVTPEFINFKFKKDVVISMNRYNEIKKFILESCPELISMTAFYRHERTV